MQWRKGKENQEEEEESLLLPERNEEVGRSCCGDGGRGGERWQLFIDWWCPFAPHLKNVPPLK
jgi:hypothetical protein